MQIIIKLNDNKQLQKTSSNTVYQGENNADSLLFLFPTTYQELDFRDLNVTLHWINEEKQGDVTMVSFEDELYRDTYLCFKQDITNAMTALSGTIRLWFEITDGDSELLCKTDVLTLSVNQHLDSAEYAPEETPQLFNEYKIQMQQLINSAAIIQNNIAETETRIDEKIALVVKLMEEWEAKYGA